MMEGGCEEIQNLQARFSTCRRARLHQVALQPGFTFSRDCFFCWLRPSAAMLTGHLEESANANGVKHVVSVWGGEFRAKPQRFSQAGAKPSPSHKTNVSQQSHTFTDGLIKEFWGPGTSSR